MDNVIELTSVPIIVSLVYLVLRLFRNYAKEKHTAFIPMIAAILGAVFGVIAFYCSPEIIPASNILSAIFIGMTSGLSATGVNQIYKQIGKLLDINEDTTVVSKDDIECNKNTDDDNLNDTSDTNQ